MTAETSMLLAATSSTQPRPDSGQTLGQWMNSVYDDLRRIAHRQMQGERRDHTLQTTALVNEAYLRLNELRNIEWRDRQHFFAVAAGIMRRVLVDQARANKAGKRGGGAQHVSLDNNLCGTDDGLDLIDLDNALRRLAERDEVQAKLVELRCFAGLGIAETADILGCSPATVKRKWALAQAWVYRELHSGSPS